jgi:hypothetical protein
MKQPFLLTLLITSLSLLQQARAQYDNTKYGDWALYSNTYGSYNSAFGYHALYANTASYNSAFGSWALRFNTTGSYNTASGSFALFSNTTGKYNTATGHQALSSNGTGNYNTATGYQALYFNTTGYSNSANGYLALYSNTTGAFNTATGQVALYKNTTGRYNTATGNMTLLSNATGYNNTANGYGALYSNTNGSNNTASGLAALYANTTGNFNTAFGYGALRYNTTGSYNTAVGDSAGTSTSNLSNTTALGYKAITTASNQVRVGNSSVTSIGGKVGWSTLSDGRYKKNISEDVPGLSFITKLKPVTYTLDIAAIDKASGITEQRTPEEARAKAAAAKEKHTGFVAQEVEKAATELNYDFGGVDKPKNDKDLYGLRYAEFVVPLVKAVQELDEENKLLKDELSDVKGRLAKLEALIINKGNNTITLTSAYLEQNTPNPVYGITTIRYRVPETSTSARLTLINAKGQVVRTEILSNRGTGILNINTNSLAAGTYNYTLYVDGKQADTKRLIIAP